MQVKLTKSILVGAADVVPKHAGAIVDVTDDVGAEYIRNGLGEAAGKSPASAPAPVAADVKPEKPTPIRAPNKADK